MGSLGERIRCERERQGITLESISTTTKIRKYILEAIEKGEFEKLPGGVFNKGYVRTYASLLGMDEEQAVKDYIAVAGDPEQPLPDPPVKRRSPEVQVKEDRPWGKIVAVVLCAIALLYGGWRSVRSMHLASGTLLAGRQRHPKRAKTPESAVTSDNSNSSRPELRVAPTDHPASAARARLQLTSRAAAPATPGVPDATAGRPEKFVILVKVKQPAWVSITADGKPLLEGVLGHRKTIRAHSEIVLKTTNAGALRVSRNGKPLPALGDQDEPASVTFTPDSVMHSPTASGEMREAEAEKRLPASEGADRQGTTSEEMQRSPQPGSADTPPEPIER